MEQGMSSDQPIKANKMRTAVLIVLGVSVVINIILGLVLWNRPKTVSFGADEKIYKDSINVLKRERVDLHHEMDSVIIANDSLIMLKTNAKIQYVPKIRFIYTADPAQLDSVIRAAIK